jgi:hypothetical protein
MHHDDRSLYSDKHSIRYALTSRVPTRAPGFAYLLDSASGVDEAFWN